MSDQNPTLAASDAPVSVAHPAVRPDPRSDGEFLLALGRRVRETRDRRGLTRKQLARDAGVSERHLAHLEAGEGNVSIVLLRHIASALGLSLPEMLNLGAEESVEQRLVRRILEQLPRHRLEDVVFRLMRDYGQEEAARRNRIALIGLRGAGKTTLGRRLAAELGFRFVELDAEIERETGMPMGEIFALYGQSGYRRIEQRCLRRALDSGERTVLATGGGIVSQTETYDLLLSRCLTIWLRTSPEEHMQRVSAQGDLRPMAGSAEAMEDLRRILAAREPQYLRADHVVDTSGQGEDESFRALRAAVEDRGR
ncbi:helix-turn-helix transcriptional regulator [Thauera sp. SWB20]|uniref:helix-turn-helix transcriptional regulator n=1 Tax=Thauera sp. SWB20 TaxID=1572758 RepID=UPI0005ADCAA3|nr:helix-turn-helix transcriptional regulator [Thauera sp. SWB20]KIN88862.1 helix-turn-helix family protein [Thauera sp. SWB20]